jgi:hypothetical protein
MMAKKPKYKYPLVQIVWVDAETEHGWEEVEEDSTLPVATTIGFLIKDQPDKNGNDMLLIASTYSDSQTNGRFKIPKAMVKEMMVLK